MKLAVIGGDGIGPEVVNVAMGVMKAVAPQNGFQFESTEFPFSAKHFLDTGHVLDDVDIATLRNFLPQ